MKIAFIGTGIMGSAMARNLLKNNHEVTVFNRTISKAQALVQDGARCMESIEACVQNAELIITMVGYPKDVEEVYETIFQAAKPGTIAVDMTTSSPSLAKKLAERGKTYQIEVLDAPVSGGDIGAQKGTLSIMIGGKKEVAQRLMPIFSCMGTQIVYQGEAGAGQHAKMANQIAIAGTLAAVSEALRYGEAAGLQAETLLSAIGSGAAGSWQMSNNGPRMLKEDYAPGFMIHHFIKDMKLAQEEAALREIALPVLDQVEALFEKLAAAGFEKEGTQAIWRAYHD